MSRYTRRYREAWETKNSLPASCYFCGKIVRRWGRKSDEGSIHHINGDHDDHRVENLAAAHMRCHVGYHSHLRLGQPKSDHHRAAMSRAARARTPEHQAKITAAQTGKPKYKLRDRAKTPAHRAAISVALRRRTTCPKCEYENTVAQVGRHRKALGH